MSLANEIPVVAIIDSTQVTSRSVDVAPQRNYCWKVVARSSTDNTLIASSEYRRFSVPAVIQGRAFDATGYDCGTAGSAPGLGGTIGLSSEIPNSYTATVTNGDWSQRVLTRTAYTFDSFNFLGYVSEPTLTCSSTGSTVSMWGDGNSPIIRDFGFTRVFGGWWQGVGGSVYGDNLQSTVPSTVTAENRYLLVNDANGQSGVVAYKTAVDVGNGMGVGVTPNDWKVNSGYEGRRTTYEYFEMKWALLTASVWNGGGKPAYNGGADGYMALKASGDQAIRNWWNGDWWIGT
jgi:hypothetical protein